MPPVDPVAPLVLAAAVRDLAAAGAEPRGGNLAYGALDRCHGSPHHRQIEYQLLRVCGIYLGIFLQHARASIGLLPEGTARSAEIRIERRGNVLSNRFVILTNAATCMIPGMAKVSLQIVDICSI